jgi:hypothetical protein
VKILCLFVRHGTVAYPDALEVLDQWYEKHGLLDQRQLWILDNSLATDVPARGVAPGVELRTGDNEAWEFSTWERAVAEASAENSSYDIVHFVTSAFNTLYTGYLDHFFPDMLDYVIERNVCLGHVDGYDIPIRMGDVSSQSWIRTCFFFLPWKQASTMSPWATYRTPQLIFENSSSRQFRANAPIDKNYQARLVSWLEGDEMGGHRWHTPVSRESADTSRFQYKTLAILNEHQLAINFRQAGIRLVDFCWLHAFRTTPVPIISDPPEEALQMKIRRKLLGFQEGIRLADHIESHGTDSSLPRSTAQNES